MDRIAIIRAAYFAVLAVGGEPSQRTVQLMAKRICGKGFRTAEVLDALADFRKRVAVGKQSGSSAVAPLVLKTTDPVAPQKQSGSHSRARHKVLVSQEETARDSVADATPSLSGSDQTSSADFSLQPPEPKPSKRVRKPRQTALPLDFAHQARARDILDLIFARLDPHVHERQSWYGRQKPAALRLATLDRSDQDIVRAHELASRGLPSPAFSINRLIEFIPRLENEPAPREYHDFDDEFEKGNES